MRDPSIFSEYLSAPLSVCPLFRNHDSKWHVSAAMDGTTIKVIGDKLREHLPLPETKSSKDMRELLVKLERRAREQKNEREQNRKPH